MSHETPGSGTVPVQNIKVFARQKLASVNARLNGAQTSQDSHLLYIAHERDDVEPFQFGVHRMKAAHKMFKKQLERLRQTEHRVALNHKCGHFLSTIVHQFTLVSRWIRRANGWRRIV